jgi:quercetin dioxygenase-like cupin family protein
MNVTADSPRTRHLPKGIAIALCGGGLLLLPTAAQATPPSGLTGTVLATGTMTDPVEIRTKGPTDFVFQLVTIVPGGTSGWHYHPGNVLVVVSHGTVTRTDSDCNSVSYSAGQSFVEPGGPHHVHRGSNFGKEPAELYLTYVNAAGGPLSVDQPDPGCGDRRAVRP